MSARASIALYPDRKGLAARVFRARRVRTELAATFDRAVYSALTLRGDPTPDRARVSLISPRDRLDALDQLIAAYARPRFLAEPEAFFAAPVVEGGRLDRKRGYGREGDVFDLEFESEVELFSPAVAEQLRGRTQNGVGLARLYLHRDRPRPLIVLVHGYLTGRLAFEERFWPVRTLFDGGLDVAIAVLPHHGARGSLFSRPILPSSDPRVTIEGFRQAVHDLRAIIAAMLARGAPAAGVMGMSLGGYVASLVATIEPRLSFVVPYLPLSSIPGFARDAGRFTGTVEEQRAQFEKLELVYRVVSPLARPALAPREGRLVLAGAGDRVVPKSHAEAIAEHFEVPVSLIRGGHLLQFDRSEAFSRVFAMLRASGVL